MLGSEIVDDYNERGKEWMNLSLACAGLFGHDGSR